MSQILEHGGDGKQMPIKWKKAYLLMHVSDLRVVWCLQMEGCGRLHGMSLTLGLSYDTQTL